MKSILLHLPSQLERGVESKEDDNTYWVIYFGYFSRYLLGEHLKFSLELKLDFIEFSMTNLYNISTTFAL